jgi:Peptidase A4 family
MVSDSLRRIIRRLLLVSLSCAVTFGFGPYPVMASDSPPAGSVAADQSIAQAIMGYPTVPPNFNPLSASDTELQTYGFPPRPDAVRTPNTYARWKRLISVPRVGNPKLQQTTIYNSAIQNLLSSQMLRNGAVAATSINWSGYADVAPSGTFTVNNSFVAAEWVVPRAQQAFGVCNGSWDYSSQWAGFDGVTSNDVLQAGTEVDACCGDCGGGSTQAAFYSSWIEWAPLSEVRVSVPAVRPGDLISLEVWFTTTPPFGHAALANYTLQQSQAYAFNPPAGTAFAGDSAEWILERPFIGGLGFSDLTNYAADQFNADYAFNSSSYFVPGTSPGGTSYAITMVCPPWIPSASCPTTTVLSTPYLYSPWALWFYDSPPALY